MVFHLKILNSSDKWKMCLFITILILTVLYLQLTTFYRYILLKPFSPPHQAPKHSTSLPVLKRTRTISLSRNFTAANKDPVSQSRDSKCDPVLRSILKKQRGDEANSVDWELTFGRSNTFAGRRSLARKKLRRKKIVKHVSIHNIPSISSVPSVVSTTSQDSTSTRKGTSERPPIHSKSKDKKAVRGKSKQKDKRYYPKSQQNNQDPSTQRIISPIPNTEESSTSILKSNKSSPSVTKSNKSSPSNSKSNKLIPDNPQFAADAAPLPDIPRLKTKNTTKTDRIRQGKKSTRYKAKDIQTKSETEIDGGTTYRVIPISDMNRLAQERSEGTTGTTGTEVHAVYFKRSCEVYPRNLMVKISMIRQLSFLIFIHPFS